MTLRDDERYLRAATRVALVEAQCRVWYGFCGGGSAVLVGGTRCLDVAGFADCANEKRLETSPRSRSTALHRTTPQHSTRLHPPLCAPIRFLFEDFLKVSHVAH